MKQYISEAFGTFLLVFFGTGAIIINEWSGGSVTHSGIALAFGLVVLVAVNALGPISGAHINPAVTIAFTIAGRFPFRSMFPYIIAQVTGAVAASFVLLQIFPASRTLGSTLPSGTHRQSFVLEIILSFILMLVILFVVSGSKEQGMQAGLTIGATVALEALVAGPISGASMNPARSLGPALMSGTMETVWIYILAPVTGMVLAVIIHRLMSKAGYNNNKMTPKKILFVCIENSNRSQMAQAFARIHGGEKIEAYSAGSAPSGKVNPKAIAAMKEIGYNLSDHSSKSLEEVKAHAPFDVVVTMGCGDACPWMPAKQFLDWQIPDPRHMDGAEFNQVRDLISEKVKELVEQLAD